MANTPPTAPPPYLADSELSGRQLGDFHLLRRLGRGAMADVYLAEQSRLKRRVAVKILRPELAGDPTYLQRFQFEAQAAASLVHANIVQIHEVGCVDQLHYIAQEYVQGQNLREYLARHGPPDLPHALSIMRQVAAALNKAAEQGVVHRDIKPENIMLTTAGEVKVADFGLARLAQAGQSTDLTQVGMTLGTPLYMSPEQVEGKPLDGRSDIYSFGVTCYQMLSGAPPFRAETALAVAVQHLKSEPEPLELRRADLPADLCRIVHRMLAKEPSRRFATARDLLRELRRVQVEHFGDDWPENLPAWEGLAAETVVDPPAAAIERLDRVMKSLAAQRVQNGRRRWFVTALAVAFLLGGLCAWWTVAPTSLLADAKPEIARQDSVLRQWYFASQIGSEEAWQSVIKYFPEKKDFAARARQQLALIYLREGDLARAMPIFDELARVGDEEEWRAFGLAGQGAVLSLRGRYRESAEALAQFWPIRGKLKSQPLAELVDHAIRKNDSQLGSQTAREWDEWLAEQFPEGS
jgi:serine/threonine-protein kinase